MLLINHRKNLLFNYYSFYCVSLLLFLLLSHIIETVVELVIASNRKRLLLLVPLARIFTHFRNKNTKMYLQYLHDLHNFIISIHFLVIFHLVHLFILSFTKYYFI